MTRWLIINGSPRINGTSARVIRMLRLLIEQSDPDVELVEFEVARLQIEGCNGCDFCKTSDECIIEDDMTRVIDELDAVDRVILVTPIYFAGLPSQTKALLDRLQPYYWDYVQRKEAGQALRDKRPLTLYVVGDGGDPHGCEPLIASVRSAFAVAGFRVDKIVELVGIKRISAADLHWEEEA